jgi:RimJ/RimL family protein N-acetyltransferase
MPSVCSVKIHLPSAAPQDTGREPWSSVRRPHVVGEIDDPRVRLRPILEDDLPMLDRFLGEAETAGEFGWFGWGDPQPVRRRWAENRLLGEEGARLMVIRGDERLGFVAWNRVQATRTSYYWSVGIGLLPEARGRGYGTTAQRLLVRHLFAHTTVNRIQADTEVDNVAERRALEKAGFTEEGILRGVGFRDGRWRDGVRYSVIRSDLDPGDGSGASAGPEAR